MDFALALLSGALLALSFPKFGHSSFGWIALAPLLVALAYRRQSFRRSFALGLLAGFVYFAGTLYWFVAAVAETALAGVASERTSRMHLTSGDRRFSLADGALLIGRADDAAIRIDAGGVSRHHARIVVSGEEARLEDLGSKNGTFVEVQPVIGTRLLMDGNEIRVGPMALTFRVAPAGDATDTMN